MVIWIGQIACHSAIQQPGCAMRTANRWGAFISFLTMPWEKKKTYFKHSDGYLNICSINPKRFLPKPCCRLCAHDERCCSLLWQGSKAAGAKGSPRGSQHQGGWAGTPAHAMESTGELQHGHGECVTNVWCQGIIPIPHSADWKSALPGTALLPVGLGASKGPAPRPLPAANGKVPIWRMTGF